MILRELAQLLQTGRIKAHVQKVLLLEQAGQAQPISKTRRGRGHLVLRAAMEAAWTRIDRARPLLCHLG